MFSCIRSFRRCWCEPWKTLEEAVRAFFTICGWVSYKTLDSIRDNLEIRKKNLLSLPSSVCQYGVNLHGFSSVQYSRNFTKYDWWSTCILVGFVNSLCWPPFWERRVLHRALPICTPSVPIFPVCITLRTLQDDHFVFLRELWIYHVELAYFSSMYNSQDFARWSLCVLEGAMNLLRRPPFCGQGWRRVVAQLRLWIQRYGVEFVCPLLCCEKLSGLTIPVLPFLFFIWLNLIGSPPSLEDRFELGERILRL